MMEVKDATFIRMGFYQSGIDTIKDLLAEHGRDELASTIEALQVARPSTSYTVFYTVRLNVTDWETISDAFLEHSNTPWEASLAEEINDRLRNHGWR